MSTGDDQPLTTSPDPSQETCPPIRTHPQTGKPIGAAAPVTDPAKCGAKLRNSDPTRYCTQWAVKGSERCRLHGGKTPRGLASPAFRNGTHSLYMPQRLRPSYEAALADPDLLSLRREIAAHRAAADDLRRRLDDGEGAGAGLGTAWRDFKTAHRAGHPDRLADALTRLDAAISQNGAQDGIRKELRAETDLISKLTRGENDRMEQLHQMVSREQALAYMRGLAVAVKEAMDTHVTDRNTRTIVLRAVSARFEQLADRRGAPDISARGHIPELVDSEDRE